MLQSFARQYYFDKLRNKDLSLLQLSTEVQKPFYMDEYVRALQREWETVSINATIFDSPDKTATENLEKLVCWLQDIRASLPIEYEYDSIIQNRPLNAVRDVDECLLVYFKPAETVHIVIPDLHSSMSTVPKQVSVHPVTPTTHISDRRYFSGENSEKGNKDKNCFVRGKPGCWSTKHSSKERSQAFRKNKRIKYFVADLSADNQNSKSYAELEDAFEKVVIRMQDIWSNTSA